MAKLAAYNGAILDSLSKINPYFVTGVFALTREVISASPDKAKDDLESFEGWSMFVFALPINDQALWIWHKAENTRLLFANYVLMRASQSIQEMLGAADVDSVDVPSRFGERLSMTVLGERAGLGTRGLNNLLLHPEYGSWLQIHAILINQKLAYNEPLAFSVCTECNNCISACPAKALEPDHFYSNRCSVLVASPWLSRSKAIALTQDSYIECAECITSCPIGQEPEGLFAWQR